MVGADINLIRSDQDSFAAPGISPGIGIIFDCRIRGEQPHLFFYSLG